ncbi:hypothetical protein BV898_09711 [Hypsibius exemplaris]|uniref:Uncharacterized protein n=1 Tax=Hypsibius exemplaris TaxID=2072580 RepID=A0A1W0WLZ5_HYPEX|nr:hypothetical protein BV898_09711 [Hypsibius exemplaris]
MIWPMCRSSFSFQNRKDNATDLISELVRDVGALQRILESNNAALFRRAFRGFADRLRGFNAESDEQSPKSPDASFDVDTALESGISTSTLLALRLQVAEALGKPVYDEPDDALDFDVLATDVSELQFTALNRRIELTIPGRIDLIYGHVIFRRSPGRHHGRGTAAIVDELAEAGIRSSKELKDTRDSIIKVPGRKFPILPDCAYEPSKRSFKDDTWKTSHLPTIVIEMELDKTVEELQAKMELYMHPDSPVRLFLGVKMFRGSHLNYCHVIAAHRDTWTADGRRLSGIREINAEAGPGTYAFQNDLLPTLTWTAQEVFDGTDVLDTSKQYLHLAIICSYAASFSARVLFELMALEELPAPSTDMTFDWAAPLPFGVGEPAGGGGSRSGDQPRTGFPEQHEQTPLLIICTEKHDQKMSN